MPVAASHMSKYYVDDQSWTWWNLRSYLAFGFCFGLNGIPEFTVWRCFIGLISLARDSFLYAQVDPFKGSNIYLGLIGKSIR